MISLKFDLVQKICIDFSQADKDKDTNNFRPSKCRQILWYYFGQKVDDLVKSYEFNYRK